MDEVLPKFTIITITRNHRVGLCATLESIRAQSYRDFELIVVDGHSTDGSDAVIEAFADIITHAENDRGKGIYAAMNQGALLASGAWTIFMNAGDRFFDETVLEKAVKVLDGELAYGRVWRDGKSAPVKHQSLDNIWKGNAFCHQALFTRTEWVKRFPFDTRYRIVGDYNFYITALKHGARFHALDLDVASIEATGLSEEDPLCRIQERYQVCRLAFRDKPLHRYYLPQLFRLYRMSLIKRLREFRAYVKNLLFLHKKL